MPPARSARTVFASALPFECLLERCVSERRSGVRFRNAVAPPVYPFARLFMVLTSHFQALCSAGDRRPATHTSGTPAFQAGGAQVVAAEEVVAEGGRASHSSGAAAGGRCGASGTGAVGAGPCGWRAADGWAAGSSQIDCFARLEPRGEPSGLLRQGAAWRSL